MSKVSSENEGRLGP